MPNIGPLELIIVLVVVLLLFGSTKLPKLARSIGEASQEFKKGVSEGGKDDAKASDKPEADRQGHHDPGRARRPALGAGGAGPQGISSPLLGNPTAPAVVLDDRWERSHVGGGRTRPRSLPLHGGLPPHR